MNYQLINKFKNLFSGAMPNAKAKSFFALRFEFL